MKTLKIVVLMLNLLSQGYGQFEIEWSKVIGRSDDDMVGYKRVVKESDF